MWWGQASPGASSSMVRGYISDRGANITQSEKTFFYDDSKPKQYSTIFKYFNDWIHCPISSIVLWSTTNLLLLFFSLFVTETFLSLFLFGFFWESCTYLQVQEIDVLQYSILMSSAPGEGACENPLTELYMQILLIACTSHCLSRYCIYVEVWLPPGYVSFV